ncbi:bifunctional tRNA (5-methylaminomethyl-2-thiouridine)(34)-methyltransferase MnmD/FAD-dependent 5-carboxymethylaminomethyl-2-thiouridine(34) oxidoreductase MnmC [Pseudomonas sp. Z8(2022)]|uniref:bifunctional tRNA (5-methylaminomethyl-2-thiouridine)(34)-methyltransferase MnmD/FAD-dependent 5-carboxymethylaminomethyl-2-thiouridine(34) oxidoreductase MnmC n=1 Tax=Pseudomonas sp. Z8(2022) TaxID=2962597 RepID=UPI0021F44CCD|nr:bifunctional tRNA (5-methylaminomethyl-2-thiouridine)(34)-methyltransferase MnmD/FAD-dependent 5-carboxymethylaminomethyl-2-thiouridine(34) oxidoreductase MnmC [Pseudomonas sp. Z8(2022)]UYP31665.1 bifunctional tRNA (5-methylaminomethyl-2-thiouridine)(34)-methyltransferase MnmD/FAD-dependent 5-carboxymethylaminomethyl-2-thiouridine(34) oxidoreductase MnmC [Pseudomonas sp. Z8(2022)]
MSDVHNAQLDWDEHGQPLSRSYGDVYFSRANGLEETRHVFLAHNRIIERCQALPAGGRLIIGETGFGTGLNFLCAWQAFAEHAPQDARLHFVSVEKFPLTQADLQRALALWPELAPYAGQLLAQYRAIHPGFQRLLLDGGRVVLTLMVGDVLECLPQLDARVDAWFLDGFAPSKNPEMWTDALFTELARLSAPGATLATFTSAGFVRRGLIAAGFAMVRVKGFGHKREMLAGPFQAQQMQRAVPWFARPALPTGERQAVVIGAGLAGCATAASLAARGWRVTLLERHDDVAREASGNPQGVLYLKLSAHGTALSRLIVAGFGHTRRLLERLQRGIDWDACGVLQLAFDAKEAERQSKLAAAFPSDLLHALSQDEAEQLAGIGLPAGGLFYPDAGWVHPPALCRQLVQHPLIELRPYQEALSLSRQDGRWRVAGENATLAEAPVLVLACAAEISRLLAEANLPLKRIRGQISRLPASAASSALRTVVCAEGYVAPPRGGEHTLGASFDFHSADLTPSVAEHAGNLELLREISLDLAERLDAQTLDPATLQGRAAFRCTSPDYLPLVGPLAEQQAFNEAYAVLARDARQIPETPCPWLPGLYINSGHGSRGLITAPLSGELIAAWLENEPLPVPRDVADASHPNRFMLRTLIRRS